MSSSQGGKLVGVDEEGVDLDIEGNLGREGSGVGIQEHGVGGSGPLDRGSGSTPPDDGRNVSGSLRLPLGETDNLNQPSWSIIGSTAGNIDSDQFRGVGKGHQERNWRGATMRGRSANDKVRGFDSGVGDWREDGRAPEGRNYVRME